MGKNSGSGSRPAKSRSNTAVTPKHRDAPKVAPASSPSGTETEVAQLARELGKARERQTATAEVLSLISDSPTDLQSVFDRIVKNAARLCQSVLSAVYRRTAGRSPWSRTISSLQNGRRGAESLSGPDHQQQSDLGRAARAARRARIGRAHLRRIQRIAANVGLSQHPDRAHASRRDRHRRHCGDAARAGIVYAKRICFDTVVL